ncbi:glycosyltransferase involved in cell wall biosynthesis [Pedobacter sp. CG_S7]|uniref:XrtY-associated glycosyltransferase XYAG1 n=1 Tax=Pedobacter sp. CG_S7 TaxID=3143930 RepID=UPI003395E164
MITILQVTPAYKPAYIYGGPTLSVSKLCEELHKNNFKIKVLTSTANGNKELHVKTNVLTKVAKVDVYYFLRLTKDNTHFTPTLLFNLIKMIKEDKLENPNKLVIHIHSWWNTISIFSCMIGLWYKIPVLLSPRGMLTTYTLKNRNSFYKYLIHQLLGKHLLKKCYLHVTTVKEKQDVHKTTDKYKGVNIIPNFVEYPCFFHSNGRIEKQQPIPIKLLFLSRIEEKKGLDLLIMSLPLLKINWQLTIAGHGKPSYVKYLEQLCQDLKLHQKINWIGAVNNIKKFEIIRKHDLFILPSYNENFANVVIESLSVGTAVVVTKEVGLANYVLKHNLGWVTELSVKNIAHTINLAAGDYNKRDRIRKVAPKIIRKDYSEMGLIIQYTNMYHQILKNVN